ncbi:MAG: zinc metallopeptidase [Akkermansiaceae bacterium]|nr:zinc metallopeptidase [Akkermansiaceae bacterium]
MTQLLAVAPNTTPLMPPLYWLILGGTLVLSLIVSSVMKRRFTEYSQIPLAMTGAEVAEAMLRQHGIRDVKVMSTPGQLTDHYDPLTKTVNLSEVVYGMNSVAAAAVAAHEVGHAVQHQQAYRWLEFRSKMVPAVQIASKGLNLIMMLSLMGMFFLGNPQMLLVYIALLGVVTLFSLVTLPVEWLESSGLARSMETERAKNALFWAAMTYVVAALGSLAQLLYFIMIFLGRRE